MHTKTPNSIAPVKYIEGQVWFNSAVISINIREVFNSVFENDPKRFSRQRNILGGFWGSDYDFKSQKSVYFMKTLDIIDDFYRNKLISGQISIEKWSIKTTEEIILPSLNILRSQCQKNSYAIWMPFPEDISSESYRLEAGLEDKQYWASIIKRHSALNKQPLLNGLLDQLSSMRGMTRQQMYIFMYKMVVFGKNQNPDIFEFSPV